MLANDFAFVGDNQPAAVGPGLQPDDSREAMDFRAGLARGDGISLRHAIRIDVSAVLAVQRADELIIVDQRIEFLGLAWRNELHLEAQILAAAVYRTNIVEHRLVRGENKVACRVNAARLA